MNTHKTIVKGGQSAALDGGGRKIFDLYTNSRR